MGAIDLFINIFLGIIVDFVSPCWKKRIFYEKTDPLNMIIVLDRLTFLYNLISVKFFVFLEKHFAISGPSKQLFGELYDLQKRWTTGFEVLELTNVLSGFCSI